MCDGIEKDGWVAMRDFLSEWSSNEVHSMKSDGFGRSEYVNIGFWGAPWGLAPDRSSREVRVMIAGADQNMDSGV